MWPNERVASDGHEGSNMMAEMQPEERGRGGVFDPDEARTMSTTTELSRSYDPTQVEPRWYRNWLDNRYFHADATTPKAPFTIVIPPPNVTGSLHMGHALTDTIEDV